MTDLQTHLKERLVDLLGLTTDDERNALLLSPPKNKDHGDVALGCFALAKQRKMAPPTLAQEIADKVDPDEVIASAGAAGPFVNFRFHRAALAKEVVTGALTGAAPYGPKAYDPATGNTVVIDFSSPNIAKPFHMGHLRSTVIGAALGRIHRHLGNKVEGINHLGDWGMPFAKMMTAFLRWGDKDELNKSPMRYMFELYVRYSGEAKNDPSLDEEAARRFQALESGEDNEERRMWQFLRDESLKAFQGPYERLKVSFDHFTGESFYEDKMEGAMQRVTAAGVLETSEGAEVVDLKAQGIKVPCLLRKSDGTTLYHTRDLAAVFYRDETYHPARLLYVVGAEQKLHFMQLVGVLKKMGEPLAKKFEHVPFGLILAKDGEGKWAKFASRGGNAIFLDEVLDEAVASARKTIAEKNPALENADEVAEQVGVGAIVFNDLKNSRIKDVKFDWDQMLAFEGDTGPYVQYAGARLSSILRKGGVTDPQSLIADIDWELLADADAVLLAMQEFGTVVQRAADKSEPSTITNYLLQFASAIHSYLYEHHVLTAEPATKHARLALVAAGRELLRRGLGLLGVASPDAM